MSCVLEATTCVGLRGFMSICKELGLPEPELDGKYSYKITEKSYNIYHKMYTDIVNTIFVAHEKIGFHKVMFVVAMETIIAAYEEHNPYDSNGNRSWKEDLWFC